MAYLAHWADLAEVSQVSEVSEDKDNYFSATQEQRPEKLYLSRNLSRVDAFDVECKSQSYRVLDGFACLPRYAGKTI